MKRAHTDKLLVKSEDGYGAVQYPKSESRSLRLKRDRAKMQLIPKQDQDMENVVLRAILSTTTLSVSKPSAASSLTTWMTKMFPMIPEKTKRPNKIASAVRTSDMASKTYWHRSLVSDRCVNLHNKPDEMLLMSFINAQTHSWLLTGLKVR